MRTLRVLIVESTSPTLLALWKSIQSTLHSNGYTTVTRAIPTDAPTDRDTLLQRVKNDGIDIVVGEFPMLPHSFQHVQLTQPIKVNEQVVLQRKRDDEGIVAHTFKLFLKYYLPMVFAIAVLGVVLYYLIHYICIRLDVNLREWVASLFGCYMYVHDVNLTKTYDLKLLRSCFVFLILLIVSTFTYSLLTAHITSKMIVDDVRELDITVFNLKQKRLLCPRGYTTGRTLQFYGAHVDDYEGTADEAVQDFLHHPQYQHYDGLAMYAEDEHKHRAELRRSKALFGMSGVCFAVHPQHTEVVYIMNTVIAQHNVNLITYAGCKREGLVFPMACVL